MDENQKSLERAQSLLEKEMREANNGKGLRFWTGDGQRELEKRTKLEKRKRKIHWNKDVSNLDWYLAIEKELLKPEFEMVYYIYNSYLIKYM